MMFFKEWILWLFVFNRASSLFRIRTTNANSITVGLHFSKHSKFLWVLCLLLYILAFLTDSKGWWNSLFLLRVHRLNAAIIFARVIIDFLSIDDWKSLSFYLLFRLKFLIWVKWYWRWLWHLSLLNLFDFFIQSVSLR